MNPTVRPTPEPMRAPILYKDSHFMRQDGHADASSALLDCSGSISVRYHRRMYCSAYTFAIRLELVRVAVEEVAL